MSYSLIDKTDNFQTVRFDGAPTAQIFQELYDKGWMLTSGPFQQGMYYTALFFRGDPVRTTKGAVCIVRDRETKLYTVFDADTDYVISHSWATFNAAKEAAESEGYRCI